MSHSCDDIVNVWGASAPIVGNDFRSCRSGFFRDPGVWEYLVGSIWVGAKIGQWPTVTNDVFINAGHTVTLEHDQAIKDLNVNVTADVVRLDCKTFTLTITDGTLRGYTGANPGTDSALSGISGWITGKIKALFTVGGGDFLAAGQWGTNANNDKIELILNNGAATEISLRSDSRFKDITIEAGIWRFRNDLQLLKGVSVNGGQMFISSTIGNTFEFIFVGSAGELKLDQSASDLKTKTHTRAGTLILSGSGTDFPTNTTGPAWTGFSTAKLLNGSTPDLVRAFQIAKELEVEGNALLVLNGFVLSFTATAGILFSGSVAAVSSLANWPLIGRPFDATFSNSAGVKMSDQSRLVYGIAKITESLDVADETIANRIDTDQEFWTELPAASNGGIDNVNFVIENSGGALIQLFP